MHTLYMCLIVSALMAVWKHVELYLLSSHDRVRGGHFDYLSKLGKAIR